MISEPTPLKSRKAGTSKRGVSLLVDLSALVSKTLREKLKATFDSCDDIFFDLASRAKSANDQNRYFESLREIRQRKETVTENTLERIAASFRGLEKADTVPPRAATRPVSRVSDDLQLVTAEQTEKDIVVTDMVAKARVEFQQELLQLYQRVQAVSSQRLEVDDYPLDPGRVTGAFTNACGVISVDLNVLKIIYKQFDRLVLRDLEELYLQANQLFIDARILPQLPTLIVRKPVSADERREPPQKQEDGARSQTVPLGISDPDPDIRELANLLRRMRAGGIRLPMFPQFPPPTSGPELSRDELVSLISDVQTHRPLDEDGELKPLDIRNAIEAIITSRLGKFSLGTADEDTINVIAMFFDIILDDRNIPLEIQALVSRLQIPILKIALKDRSFFTDRKHPARQLINEIARTSIGWEASTKAAQDALYIRLTETVEEILSDSTGSVTVFDKCLNELKGFIAQNETRAAKVEKRTEEKASAEARTNRARDTVKHIMHDRLEGKELPVEISSFLVDEWQQVLHIIYLKHGKESVEWVDAVQTVDDLVWSVQPHKDEKSRARLLRLLPDLNRRMAAGMEHTQSHADNAAAKLEVIGDVHRRLTMTTLGSDQVALQPLTSVQRRQITPQSAPEEKSWKEMTAVERQQVQYEALMYDYLKRADEMAIGTWLLYEDLRRGNARRCKLSARISESSTFIFVNRFGVKVVEKPRKSFAYDLQMGHVRIIETTPIFERTLDNIKVNLRKLVTEI